MSDYLSRKTLTFVMSQDQARKQKEAIGRRQFSISSSEKLIDRKCVSSCFI